MATSLKAINHKLNLNVNDPDALKDAMASLLSEHEKQKQLWTQREQSLLEEKEKTERELTNVAQERDSVKVLMRSMASSVKAISDALEPLDPAPSSTCLHSTKVNMAKESRCKPYQKFRFMTHTTSSVRKFSETKHDVVGGGGGKPAAPPAAPGSSASGSRRGSFTKSHAAKNTPKRKAR